MTDDSVAIVAVAFNSADVIDSFLESIAESAKTPPPVLIVDNSPADDGLSQRVARFRGVKIARPGRNLGFGAGINFGVATIDPAVKLLVFANPDTVVGVGAIDALVAAAQRLPTAAALGPLIRSADGSVYPSARKLPSLRTGIGHALFVRIWPKNPWTTSYRNDLAAIDEHPVGWLSGAFLLVRRESFTAIGGFDERYFMYFEDVDLGRNFGLAGWENYFVPSAEVLHFGAASTSKSMRPMIIAHHRSAYRYLAKRYHAWYLWPVRAVLLIGLGARGRLAKG
jgi:N-acetylglucosaminyl-diphospho-decaprenol L-rhamnosyltransferase